MKRVLILPVLILLICFTAFAQDETKFAIGLGPEWNMNSRENFALGGALSFDYNLPVSVAPFAVGVTASVSSNFSDGVVMETMGHFRWYFLGKLHSNRFSGLFVQADLGALLIFEDSETTPLFSGGLRAGFRLPLGKLFFIEPYGRVGYPFMFGFGLMAGVRF